MSLMEWALIIAASFLALNNGANDTFNGFATVWRSGTLDYKHALYLNWPAIGYPAQQDNCFTSLLKLCAASFNPSAIVR